MPNGGHHPSYMCENCSRVYDPDEDIGEKITDKNWHFEPGSIVPYGVCDCGGYIHKMVMGKPVSYAKEATNAVVQSQTGAHFLEGLLKLLSEEQRQELEVTGCITVGFGEKPGKLEAVKIPPRHAFAPIDYNSLEMRVAAQFDRLERERTKEPEVVPTFEPNFTITKEQLEMAAKASPQLTELLEKQISSSALEEYARVVNNLIGQQRREWKLKTFAERYSKNPWAFTGMLKEKP